MKEIYIADFETVNDIDDCRVWAWGVIRLTDHNGFKWGTDIDSFFEWVKEEKPTLYFHNVKFDGEFIFYLLFRNGYTYNENSKKLKPNQFSITMSDKGQLYFINLCIGYDEHRNLIKIKIYDSLKILPFSVDEMAKAFGLDTTKGEIDYNKERKIGYIPTTEEIDYLYRDVKIVSQCLSILFEQGHKKITIGANALAFYKNLIGEKRFNKLFTKLECDAFIRKSYKGGFTYCNEKIKEQDIGAGEVFDVNSLYPWVMYYKNLPYGEPIYYEGEYKKDSTYNLYVQRCILHVKLKENHIPCLQIKNNLYYKSNEYLTETVEPVELVLTSVDLEMIFNQYYILDYIPIDGWKFKSSNTLFRDYIDYWKKIKEEATISGNKSLRTLAKLFLNSLYGKFGVNPKVRGKHLHYENDMVKYYIGEEKERKSLYVALASFVTSYAREKTIKTAQKVYKYFLYADTDSLHLKEGLKNYPFEIDNVKLGAWKLENHFSRARFLRQKSYIEEIEGELKITCAGMPKSCYTYVTWENFRIGNSFPGHLQTIHAKGGIVLQENLFTIKK